MNKKICAFCKKEFLVYPSEDDRKFCSHKCYSKQEKIDKCNEKNPMWKGNEVGKKKLHEWVKRRKPKPQFCECCGNNNPYDLANISGKYKRDINDFEWLCRSCHMHQDGRINNLKQFKKEEKK